eukprot:4221433-Heterocapsa_arctica.AAC.1
MRAAGTMHGSMAVTHGRRVPDIRRAMDMDSMAMGHRSWAMVRPTTLLIGGAAAWHRPGIVLAAAGMRGMRSSPTDAL